MDNMIPLDLREDKDKYAIKAWMDPIACLELHLPNLQISDGDHILLGTINSKRGMLFKVLNCHKLNRTVIRVETDLSVKEEYLWIRAEYVSRNSWVKKILVRLWP